MNRQDILREAANILDALHATNTRALATGLRRLAEEPEPTPAEEVYVVEREGGDGLETDIFLDYALAQEWRKLQRGQLRGEPIMTREHMDAMIYETLKEEEA